MFMIVMFILMALPLIALSVFWLLPLAQAVPIYLVCVSLSVWMFWIMRRNKKYRVVTGKEGLIGREAEITSTSAIGKETAYTLRVEGELWTAYSHDPMKISEKAIITASEGNMLIIKPRDNI